MANYSSGEISVGMYKLRKTMKEFYSDLLAAHQRKCIYTLAGMATWTFFSRQKVMKSLLVLTGYKSLQSVNCHDSHAHGYERSGILAGLVSFGMVWIGYVWLENYSWQL
jgi:hypothetical protein